MQIEWKKKRRGDKGNKVPYKYYWAKTGDNPQRWAPKGRSAFPPFQSISAYVPALTRRFMGFFFFFDKAIMEKGVPENDSWDGDSHVSQLPLPQMSFQKLPHHAVRSSWLPSQSKASEASGTDSGDPLTVTFNDKWPPARTLPSPEKNDCVGSIPSSGFSTHIFVLTCSRRLPRGQSEWLGTAAVMDSPSKPLDPRDGPSLWHQETCQRRKTETAQKGLPLKPLWMSWDEQASSVRASKTSSTIVPELAQGVGSGVHCNKNITRTSKTAGGNCDWVRGADFSSWVKTSVSASNRHEIRNKIRCLLRAVSLDAFFLPCKTCTSSFASSWQGIKSFMT